MDREKCHEGPSSPFSGCADRRPALLALETGRASRAGCEGILTARRVLVLDTARNLFDSAGLTSTSSSQTQELRVPWGTSPLWALDAGAAI